MQEKRSVEESFKVFRSSHFKITLGGEKKMGACRELTP